MVKNRNLQEMINAESQISNVLFNTLYII